MVRVHAVPAIRDNYIWLMVGPGGAAPIIEALLHQDLSPTALFFTHHHGDHIGGIDALCARYPLEVYGPACERIPHLTHALRQGDRVALPGLPEFAVLDVPGLSVGFFVFCVVGLFFCGVFLFVGGCGWFFEGTAAQLYASLTA